MYLLDSIEVLRARNCFDEASIGARCLQWRNTDKGATPQMERG